MAVFMLVPFADFKEQVKARIEKNKKLKTNIDSDVYQKLEHLIDNDKEYRERVGKETKKFKEARYSKRSKDMDEKWKGWISDIEDILGEDFQTVCNFSQQRVSDLINNGDGALIHAITAHYRLHREFEYQEFAKNIDEAVFGELYQKKFRTPVFEKLPDPVIPTAPFTHPPYLTRKDIRKALKKNPDSGIWLNPHNHHSIEFSGRKKEKRRLTEFMKADDDFLICPLIAPSGAGKTRLVSEWMKTYVPTVSKTKWDAGFVESRDPEPWKEPGDGGGKWSITCKTLIVIDYTYLFDKVVKQIAERARNQNTHKIRLLVIDHTYPESLKNDFFWKNLYRSGPALDYKKRKELVDPPIVLHGEAADSELLRQVIAAVASTEEHKFPCEVIKEAVESLYRMGENAANQDAVRHPLFAALAGRALRRGVDFSNWTRRDLIEYYFNEHTRLPWNSWDRDRGLAVGALVSAATLRRGIPIRRVREYLPGDASVIIDYAKRIVSSSDPYKIKPFEPDILGEAFLLFFLRDVFNQPDLTEVFINLLTASESGNEDEEIAINFSSFMMRLVRNLSNDDQSLSSVRDGWSALCCLLDPKQFPRNKPIRLAVSFAIADVMEQLSIAEENADRFSEQDNHDKTNEINDIIRHLTELSRTLEARFQTLEVEAASDHIDIDEVVVEFFCFYEYATDETKAASFATLKSIAKAFASQNEDGWSAAIAASYMGRIEVLKTLHAVLGEDILASPDNGITALMLASLNGHPLVVKYLHTHGADINDKAKDGTTALIGASRNGHLPVVKYLHANWADLHAKTEDGGTALMHAGHNGHLPVVEYLHVKGANVNAAMNDGVTALILSSRFGHLPVVKYLCANEVEIEAETNFGASALMYASQEGHLTIVKHLHSKNAKINNKVKDGSTALILACFFGHLPVVEYLQEQHADVNATINDGRSALMMASLSGHLPVVKYLHRCEVDINTKTKDGNTALMAASLNGHLPVVKYLREHDADINAKTKDGETALMPASLNGHLPVVKYLREHDADINVKTEDGETALMLASLNGHLPVVEYLHRHGADIHAAAKGGETALTLARLDGHLPVVKYLGSQIANISINEENPDWTTCWNRNAAEAGDAIAMINRAICFENGIGVNKNSVQAANWYLKAVEAGDDALRISLAVLAVVEPDNAFSSIKIDKALLPVLNIPDDSVWFDTPPISADWVDVTPESTAIITRKLVHAAILEGQPQLFAGLEVTAMRATPLTCYSDLTLVDVQFGKAGSADQRLLSAFISEHGALLLDGTSICLLKLNDHALKLEPGAVTEQYLRVFCEFVHGEQGPFSIISSIEDIPFTSDDAVMEFIESDIFLKRPFIPDGIDHWDESKPNLMSAFVLYTDVLFKSDFMIMSDGMVKMVNDIPLSQLSIFRRHYDRYFRTPLRDRDLGPLAPSFIRKVPWLNRLWFSVWRAYRMRI